MIFKRTILTKILSGGFRAEFAIVRDEGSYKAVLYVNGRHVPGPPLPAPLNPPKEDLTYWMGNKPSVGLTDDEAERIRKEVEMENAVLDHIRAV